MSAGLLLFLNASVYRDVSILIHPSIRRSVVSVSTRKRNNNNERTNEWVSAGQFQLWLPRHRLSKGGTRTLPSCPSKGGTRTLLSGERCNYGTGRWWTVHATYVAPKLSERKILFSKSSSVGNRMSCCLSHWFFVFLCFNIFAVNI